MNLFREFLAKLAGGDIEKENHSLRDEDRDTKPLIHHVRRLNNVQSLGPKVSQVRVMNRALTHKDSKHCFLVQKEFTNVSCRLLHRLSGLTCFYFHMSESLTESNTTKYLRSTFPHPFFFLLLLLLASPLPSPPRNAGVYASDRRKVKLQVCSRLCNRFANGTSSSQGLSVEIAAAGGFEPDAPKRICTESDGDWKKTTTKKTTYHLHSLMACQLLKYVRENEFATLWAEAAAENFSACVKSLRVIWRTAESEKYSWCQGLEKKRGKSEKCVRVRQRDQKKSKADRDKSDCYVLNTIPDGGCTCSVDVLINFGYLRQGEEEDRADVSPCPRYSNVGNIGMQTVHTGTPAPTDTQVHTHLYRKYADGVDTHVDRYPDSMQATAMHSY
ncbi:hypothetical protein D9C73_018969 [Collichthys lucidus]|uniref:Uncharacterized protein n=1 Tax=Collichthys lucidus TaxID=240159 RepID=A0A4U5V8L0_COLLU|nr:hypothetical protein D9C73_018969 [Collichthys lucidus]